MSKTAQISLKIGVCVLAVAVGFSRLVTSQNPGLVLAITITVVVLVFLAVIPVVKRVHEVRQKLDRQLNGERTSEQRLDELERLKRREMVTLEEYAAKRQEILKDL